MAEKVKIYTTYSPPPTHCELNTDPSLTDESFFEPLNVLVERIIRGESTTYMDAYKGEFDYDSDDDAILDNPESDFEMEDLTDIDFARDTIRTFRASDFSKEKSRSQAVQSNGATVSSSSVVDGEQSETAGNNEEQKK